MKEKENEIFFSEPVAEIMGHPPSGMVRIGTVVVLILFILFVLFTWLIKYPDVIPSPVEITTTNPPVTLVSKITGHIQQLYVENSDSVKAGQLLGIMETSAALDEIEALRRMLDTMNTASAAVLPEFTELGELQVYYATYRKNLRNLNSYDQNDFYGSRIEAIRQELSAMSDYIDKLKGKEMLYADNHNIEEKRYRRDAELFAGRFISESQFEEASRMLLRDNIELQQVKLDLSAKRIEMAQKNQLLQDYIITRSEEREKLINSLEESFLNLKAQTNIWVNTYYLISPVPGIASFTRYWSINQSVSKDDPVVSIIPADPGEFIGRVNLQMERSGKVRENQLVNIKLSGYPYLEYGMVRGVVKSKSLVPEGDTYIIQIVLPTGLRTMYGTSLEFTQNMQGTAEIITEDVRLLQKIVNPLKHMITKNKSRDLLP